MRRIALSSLLLVVPAFAQDAPTAASVTEPGRTLTRPLDIVLGGPTRRATERTVLVLLDPTEGLRTGGLADAFEAALKNNRESMAETRLGLAIVGRKELAVEPTLDHQQVLRSVRTHLQRPGDGFQNVYEGLRNGAAALARAAGDRTILLISLENGDLEDDVKKTVRALTRAQITVEVLTSEATLSDSYWAARPNSQKPQGTTLTGGDGAVTDVPWGYLFQIYSANENTPSGFAPWGLTHTAAATGGRVFLHATASQTAHSCITYGECLFCSGDHQPVEHAWNSALVSQLAPLSASREDTYKQLGRDPAFRALMKTWRAAAKIGLLRSEPAVKVSTTSASPDRARDGRDLRLLDNGNFARNAKRAEQAAQKAERLQKQLAEELEELDETTSMPRARAAAHYMVVLLQLTRLNLLSYAAYCREIVPRWERDDLPPPEILPYPDERKPNGVYVIRLSLCHGVRPFYAVELPGGEVVQAELRKLEALYNGFQRRYGKSQFGFLLRQNAIAKYRPRYPALGRGPVRRRPKSADKPPKGPITPKRPTRNGGSSGRPSGPTTGGGR